MKEKSTGRAVMIVICVLLGLVLAVGVAGTVYANFLMGLVDRVEKGNEETLPQEVIDQIIGEATVSPDETTAPVVQDEDVDWGEQSGSVIETTDDVVNILLIGQDARSGWSRSRADAMILVTFHKSRGDITLTSFLRDMYVQYPDGSGDKLNHSYVYGGMELLNQCLELNFGIQVDGNVEVDFASFPKVIDLLGGVDLELRQDEAEVINYETRRYELGSGMMHLDGAQALEYSRIRYLDIDADFSRTNRQRKVINALIEKFQDSKLTTLLGLLDDVLPMITTDLSNTEILNYAKDLFPMLSGAEIISQRVPADGAYTLATIKGMSCVVADMDAARELMEATMAE